MNICDHKQPRKVLPADQQKQSAWLSTLWLQSIM